MTLLGRPHQVHESVADGHGPATTNVRLAVPQAHLPLVTIMIPTFGQARVVGQAIDSALAQDYANLEIVVSDDASPDGTPQLMQRYVGESRLRYFRAAANRGRVGNYRYTLACLARGDYVLNLDGDDWLSDPHYITDAVTLIIENPEVSMVFARTHVYDEASGTFEESNKNEGLPVLNDGTVLLHGYAADRVSIPHGTALYRKDTALELGFYNLNVLGADSVALLSMLPGRTVGFLDKSVGVWRRHASNATWSPDVGERVDNFAIADVPAAIARKVGALSTEEARRWQRDMAVVLAQSFVEDCLVRGQWGAATRFLLRTGRQRPSVSAHVVTRLTGKGVRRLAGRNS